MAELQRMQARAYRAAMGVAAVAAILLLGAGCSEPPRPHAPASMPSDGAAPDAFALSVGQGRPTVIEFGASACASCRDMKVVLADLRKSHGTQIGIAEIDLIQQRDAIREYRIHVMPTQVFFDAQGREIGRHIGVIDGAGILARLGVTARSG